MRRAPAICSITTPTVQTLGELGTTAWGNDGVVHVKGDDMGRTPVLDIAHHQRLHLDFMEMKGGCGDEIVVRSKSMRFCKSCVFAFSKLFLASRNFDG